MPNCRSYWLIEHSLADTAAIVWVLLQLSLHQASTRHHSRCDSYLFCLACSSSCPYFSNAFYSALCRWLYFDSEGCGCGDSAESLSLLKNHFGPKFEEKSFDPERQSSKIWMHLRDECLFSSIKATQLARMSHSFANEDYYSQMSCFGLPYEDQRLAAASRCWFQKRQVDLSYLKVYW